MSDPAPEHDTALPELIAGQTQSIAAVAELIAGARRQLAILSYRLEPSLYGAAPVVDALRSFLLSHERTRLRILVNQPDLAMRRAHRLVELARRLSSRVEFRELTEEQRGIVDDCVIVDIDGVWRRERPEQLGSRLFRRAPLEARLQLRRFDPLWDESPPARAFTELRL